MLFAFFAFFAVDSSARPPFPLELAALKHGRNSIGVELDPAYCQQAASRLMNENSSLFGHARLQIELKPPAEVEAAVVLNEPEQAYKAARTVKRRANNSCIPTS